MTYPVPEDISSGLLMTIGQLTGIAYTFAMDALIPSAACSEADYVYPGSSILLVVSVIVAFCSICMYQGSTKRLEVDRGRGAAPNNLIDDAKA